MLQQRSHGGHIHGGVRSKGRRQGVLCVNGKLRFVGAAQLGGGAVVRRLHNAHIQPGGLVVAFFLGYEHTGVVGVGGPVQADGNVRLLCRCGGGVRFVRCFTAGAGGKG